MNLSEEIELEDFVQRPEKLSAADISAIWFVCYTRTLFLARARLFFAPLTVCSLLFLFYFSFSRFLSSE